MIYCLNWNRIKVLTWLIPQKYIVYLAACHCLYSCFLSLFTKIDIFKTRIQGVDPVQKIVCTIWMEKGRKNEKPQVLCDR